MRSWGCGECGGRGIADGKSNGNTNSSGSEGCGDAHGGRGAFIEDVAEPVKEVPIKEVIKAALRKVKAKLTGTEEAKPTRVYAEPKLKAVLKAAGRKASDVDKEKADTKDAGKQAVKKLLRLSETEWTGLGVG